MFLEKHKSQDKGEDAMTKVIATIAKFVSFDEIAEVMTGFGEAVFVPDEIQPGIHVVTIYDNPELFDVHQHALVVVIGDVEKKWQCLNSPTGMSPVGRAYNTVTFEQGTIPIFMNGEEVKDEINMHSLYSPSFRCIRFEKEKKEKVCIKYVEARTIKEVEDILTCERSDLACDIVDLSIRRKFPERFLWKEDKKAMEGVDDASNGPYNFVVLFFREM